MSFVVRVVNPGEHHIEGALRVFREKQIYFKFRKAGAACGSSTVRIRGRAGILFHKFEVHNLLRVQRANAKGPAAPNQSIQGACDYLISKTVSNFSCVGRHVFSFF